MVQQSLIRALEVCDKFRMVGEKYLFDKIVCSMYYINQVQVNNCDRNFFINAIYVFGPQFWYWDDSILKLPQFELHLHQNHNYLAYFLQRDRTETNV